VGMFNDFDNPLVEISKSHWRIETPFGEAKGDDPKVNTNVSIGGGSISIGGTRIDLGDITNPINRELSNAGNSINRELSNAGNSINSGLNQATGGASFEDVAFNFLTAGLLGYGEGGIKAGALTRGFTEGVGELTGANAARAANNRAEALLAEQRAEAARLREEELARLRRNDVSASRSAGRSQRAAFYGAGSGLGADSGAFNNLTRDFLGL